jgi:hypothetical protein
MEIEKFVQATKVKDKLDTLERQKHKLESALKSCSLGVTIKFTHTGAFPRKDEVSVYTKEFVKELVSKELDRLNLEIGLVKEEFENI